MQGIRVSRLSMLTFGVSAALSACSDAQNGPGGCDEGFLRDDAILVVTFISDDPNKEDTGLPQDWYNAVVTAKKGNPQRKFAVPSSGSTIQMCDLSEPSLSPPSSPSISHGRPMTWGF